MGDAAINIEMISQGSSELNVTFVVTDEDANRAMQALHAEFLTGQERAANRDARGSGGRRRARRRRAAGPHPEVAPSSRAASTP
jgi:hypothetical protein